jgi:uncharacterized delta-60 repeat protein
MKKILFLLSTMVIAFTMRSFAQPGTLYSGFGTGGEVTTPVGSSDEFIVSLARQLDDKIVAAGYSNNGTDNDFAVVRYNADGSLDNTFGSGGIVTTQVGSDNDNGEAVAIQTDGRIVVAGYSYNGSNYDFAVVRYNTNGNLDTTFSGDGIDTFAIGDYDDKAMAVGIQTDGKIVVAGSSYNGTDYEFAIVRLKSDGTFDNTFGTAGLTTTDFGSYDDIANSLRILPAGNSIVAGRSYNGTDDDFALASYTPSGTLAISFGTNGMVTTDFGSGSDIANAVFDILNNNTIVVVGSSENGSDRDFMVARYTLTGTLDNTFNSTGYVRTAIGSSNDDAHSVFPQPDGKLVVSGSTNNGADWDFAVCRYIDDGTLDSTFGTNGIVTTVMGNYNDGANSSVIQPEGYLVAGGYATNGTDADFALAEYYLWTPTSIVDATVEVNQICIYPNPVQQEVMLKYNLENSQTISVYLMDMQGRIMKSFIHNEWQSAGQQCMCIVVPDNLPSGTYQLVITTQNGTASIKLFR